MPKPNKDDIAADLIDCLVRYGEANCQASWEIGMLQRGKIAAQDALFLHSRMDEEEEKEACGNAASSLIRNISTMLAQAFEREHLSKDQIINELRIQP